MGDACGFTTSPRSAECEACVTGSACTLEKGLSLSLLFPAAHLLPLHFVRNTTEYPSVTRARHHSVFSWDNRLHPPGHRKPLTQVGVASSHAAVLCPFVSFLLCVSPSAPTMMLAELQSHR